MPKGVSMFLSEILTFLFSGIIENILFYTRRITDNKYYLLERRMKNLAEDRVPLRRNTHS
jgi:hypothetical protein